MDIIESRIIERGGHRVEILVLGDEGSHPYKQECYSAAEIAAWECGMWFFVGVRARVVAENVPSPTWQNSRVLKITGPESCGIWGIDWHGTDASRQYAFEEVGLEEADEAIGLLHALIAA